MNASHSSRETASDSASVAGRLKARFESLSPRQREVCRLMVKGMMSKQIADQLGTSINTIKTHRNEIFRKLETHSLLDLVRKIELIDRLPTSLPPERSHPGVMTRRTLQLLLIEDHKILRETFVEALERLGYDVLATGNGDELETILAARHVDIVLLDIALGEGHEDGFALAARVRQRKRCGIVMTTASSDVESRIRSYQGGADVYLIKPVDFVELDAVLQNLGRRLPVS